MWLELEILFRNTQRWLTRLGEGLKVLSQGLRQVESRHEGGRTPHFLRLQDYF